jgi:hypothetical protein
MAAIIRRAVRTNIHLALDLVAEQARRQKRDLLTLGSTPSRRCSCTAQAFRGHHRDSISPARSVDLRAAHMRTGASRSTQAVLGTLK